MGILIVCKCRVRLNIPDRFAGKRVRCPRCSASHPVPAPKAKTAPPRPRSDQRDSKFLVRLEERLTAAKPPYPAPARKRAPTPMEMKLAKLETVEMTAEEIRKLIARTGFTPPSKLVIRSKPRPGERPLSVAQLNALIDEAATIAASARKAKAPAAKKRRP